MKNFIVIKLKFVIVIAIIILIALVSCSILAVPKKQSTNTPINITIVLDAGHGGLDVNKRLFIF